MAMSEVSLAALAENLIGLPRDKVSALDIIAVRTFNLKTSQTDTKIDFKNKTDNQIIELINTALKGMKKELCYHRILPASRECQIIKPVMF